MLKSRRGLLAVLIIPMLTLPLHASSAGAVPHDDHVQPRRGNGPADSGNGQGRGNPNGANGTIKIDGADADGRFDGHPNNEPHISACFQVDLYGFDEGDTATLSFRAWSPTGEKTLIPANLYEWNTNEPWDWSVPALPGGVIDIGEDGAGGAVDIDNQVVVDFVIPPGLAPHPQHGYHVKLDAQITSGTTGEITEYKKTKVFWVSGDCTPPDPSVDIEMFVQEDDADSPTGPTIVRGRDALFQYRIENIGPVPLANVAVVDDTLGEIVSGITLAPGEVVWYERSVTVNELGQNFRESEVCGQNSGIVVCDDDPVNFFVIGDNN